MAFLGFASKPLITALPSATDSYVGGPLVHVEHNLPSQDLLLCKSCQNPMCFLSHFYCPLADSPYHRIICLFVCLQPECQEKGLNWRALRSQYVCSQSNATKSDTLWCLTDEGDDGNEGEEQDDDWGCDDEVISGEEETKTSDIVLMQGPFHCCFIDVYEEAREVCSEEQLNPEESDRNSESPVQDPSAFAAWSRADAVEREFVGEDDNAVPNAFSGGLELHLATRGEHGCEEVRYWWSGRPVFNGPPPKALADRLKCKRCGAVRVFELQIFPTLNNRLILSPLQTPETRTEFHLPDPEQLNKDWLLRITTVLVFSCSASCWMEGDHWFEECVVVQTDKDRTCVWDGDQPAFSGEGC